MNSDPGLIYYCCIAKGTTILTEFNSKDAELGEIAAKCLENTPPFHATFSHTVRSKTYSFMIDEPFAYFVITDEKLEKSEGFAFLESVRDAFVKDFNGVNKLDRLSSHCFQGEFNPIFRQLLGPALYHMDGIESPRGQRIGENGSFQYGSGPIRGRSRLSGDKGSGKMKNALLEEFKIGGRNGEKEVDDNSGNASGNCSSPSFSPTSHKNRGLYSGELNCHQKAKKVWKKQVWVILSLDLIACAILFVVWLWVCSGLKCMES
ncbi:phytolongin Phyl2.2 [Salvia miltiorrhiza]|uniref:phytolongin Phyl2.2 n=1 Tax=Salvia miltiorrhiza TaxID=226208 RepID=UPI0025AB691E|nr:phytolongin Phyl2.2 [Salvia miltiorrhiza]